MAMSRTFCWLLFLYCAILLHSTLAVEWQFGQNTDVTHNWLTVVFDTSITSPLVFATPATKNENDEAVVQVRNVAVGSFQIRVKEPSNRDQTHASETVSWMVVNNPPGNQVIQGRNVQSGKYLNLFTRSQGSGNVWQTVAFSPTFSSVPLCFSQPQTLNQDEFFHTRQRSVTANSFQFAVEREEALQNQNHANEDIAWVCMDATTTDFTQNGIQVIIQALVTSNSVTHTAYTVTFSNIDATLGLGLVMAKQHTYDGPNSGWVRRFDPTGNQVQLWIEEDKTNDNEVSHTTEIVSALAVSCKDNPVVFESAGVNGPFNNEAMVWLCTTLYYSQIVGQLPYVEYRIDTSNSVIPKVFVSNDVLPTEATHDSANLTATVSPITLSHVNPSEGTIYMGLDAGAFVYQSNITVTPASAGAVVIAHNYTFRTRSKWVLKRFTLSAPYDSINIEVRSSNPSATLEMYYRETLLPTRTRYDSRQLTPVGSLYTLQVTPSVGTEVFVGVYAVNDDANDVSFFLRPAAPIINVIDPSFGSTSGGYELTISGPNFGLGSNVSVRFGDGLCGQPWTFSTGQVLCTVPVGMGRDKIVTVTHYNVTSNQFKFHYDPPTLTSVTVPSESDGKVPTPGGVDLVLTGTNFGTNGTIFVNGRVCPHKGTYTHTSVTCEAAPGQGLGQSVKIEVASQTSNIRLLDYKRPELQSVVGSPGPTAGGTSITFLGQNFGVGGDSTATINSQSCNITFQNHSRIVCTLPAGQGKNHAINIIVASQTNLNPSSADFSYNAPVIHSITPNTTATPGGDITVRGVHFGTTGTITIGGSATCSYNASNYNDTVVVCTVPAGQGLNKAVVITVSSQSSNSVIFNYLPPTITSLSPLLFPTLGGISVTAQGNSLGTSGSATANGLPCSITFHNHTTVVCTMPAGDGVNRAFTVTVGASTSNALSFSYLPPSISTIVPSNGTTAGNTVLSLTGSNFGVSGTINVGSGICTLTGAGYSHSYIECLSPAGQGATAAVSITSGGQVSNNASFAYNPPALTEITPTNGPTQGGTTLTLKGNNFGLVSTTTVNGLACTSTSHTHTQDECTLPSGRGSNLQILLVVGDQNVSSFSFSYAPPSISGVTPSSAATAGGTIITVGGSSFDTSGNVTVGGVACPHWVAGGSYGHTEIKCILPAGQGTNKAVQVVTVDNKTSNVGTFSYSAPVVLSVTVDGGVPTLGGRTVVLTGSSLGTSGTVTIGGKVCSPTAWSHMLINCTLPAGEGASVPVVVTVEGQASTPSSITYDAPVLSSMHTPSALTNGGANLTLVGSNFGSPAAAVSIEFGVGTCPIQERNHSVIICTIPEGSGDQNVRVTVAGQQSGSLVFSYTAPFITTFTPTTGPTSGGDILTIHGSSFSLSGFVLVAGAACIPVVHNHTVVLCTLPAGSGSTNSLSMTVNGKQSNSLNFPYTAPALTSVTPSNATTAGAVPIRLTGNNLGTAGFVSVGGQSCPIVAATHTHTSVNCTLPAGQGVNLDVTILVGDQTSNAVKFHYLPPTISTVTPINGPTDGTSSYTITVAGNNFGTTGTVFVGGLPCPTATQALYTQTNIQCLLPAGQDYRQVVVVTGGQSSNGVSYKYAAPSISLGTPLNGPTGGGTMLTITGSNFGAAGNITVGPRPCRTDVTNGVYTHSRIECQVPHGVGIGNLINVTVESQWDVAAFTFGYDAPTVTGISPSTGVTAGGTNVTITGTNFGITLAASAELGGVACPILARSHTSITCVLPEGTGTNKAARVTIQGQTSSSFTAFSYAAPVLTNITSFHATEPCTDVAPTTTECRTDGGVIFTIYGSNFGPAGNATVAITGSGCTNVTHDGTTPHSKLTCTLSAGLGFDLPLTVTVNGQTSNSLLISYSGPKIFDNTLALLGQAPPPGGLVNGSSIAGGYTVEFRGKFLKKDGLSSTVKYGSGADYNNLEYTCTNVFCNASYCNCTIAVGVGAALKFSVHDGQQFSPLSTDVFYYPKPEVIPNSIRVSDLNPKANEVVGSRSEGETILFDALNVPQDALGHNSKIAVSYGLKDSGVYTQSCSSVKVTLNTGGLNTTVQCRTQPGEGGPYQFVVTALNFKSDPSPVTYKYPVSPIVYKVSGCNDTLNETINCPTIGGVQLTIDGANFATDNDAVAVRIGLDSCLSVSVQSSTRILCTLPSSAGVRVPVMVISGELFSRTQNLVSYKPPQLTALTGCATASVTGTAGCDRAGGQRLTITGTNFGSTSATVFVGGTLCTNVTHDGTTPHTKLSCTIPAGTQLLRAVLLIQFRGEISSNQLSLSYTQCAAGTYDATTSSFLDINCTNCTAGSFTNAEGQVACTECEAGFYAPADQATVCLRCTKGTFSVRISGQGATNCTQCNPGTFNNADGQDSCLPCPAGSFGTAFAATTCTSCPAGTRGGSSGLTLCTNCTAGFFSAGAGSLTCEQCPVGRFTDVTARTVCTNCAVGYANPNTGSSSCTECALGKAIGSTGQAVCIDCDSGFFANATGLGACFGCAAGKYSVKVGGVGASSCTECPVGEYIGAVGQATCLKCPSGFFNPSLGATVCGKCPIGQFGNTLGLTACFNCTAGSVSSVTGSLACSPCDPGTFAPTDALTACTQCGQGRAQSSSSATQCDQCAVGKALNTIGQPTCKDCDVGKVAGTPGLTECSRCQPGFIAASQGRTICSSCIPGRFSESEAQGFCKVCAAGTFGAAYNLTSCTSCPAGKIASASESTTCTNCSAGLFSPATGGQTCEKCPPGTFGATAGQSSCTACPVGRSQSATNQLSCDACALGRYSPATGQALCLPCPTGTFANDTGLSACLACLPGQFQGNTQRSFCEQCAAGYFSSASRQAVCVLCPSGTFSTTTGLSACTACAVGQFASASGSTLCTNCTAGQFADATGSIVCKDCDVGRYNPAGGLSFCAACSPGFSQPAVSKTFCSVCSAGKAQPGTGQGTCPDCEVGKFQDVASQPTCKSCAAGSVASSPGSTACTNCTAGFFSPSAGSLSCTACPVGRYSTNDFASVCALCPVGKFQDESGKSVCKDCAVGRAIGFEGQRACTNCIGGTFSNSTGLSTCTTCPAGYFSSFEASVCTACSAGLFNSVAGAEGCQDCAVGFVANTSAATICSACNKGRYAPAARATTCLACPLGRAASGFGSQVCDICLPGFVAASTGAITCASCNTGEVQAASGESTCTSCTAGKYSPSTGQAVCLNCPVGFFSSSSGRSSCTACPLGRAQIAPGMSTCVDCTAGSAIGAVGQAKCTECDAGRYANDTGLSSCLLCPLGRFSQKVLNKGATVCTACAAGSFAGGQGQPLCLACDFGTFTNVTGSSVCKGCLAGSFADFSGATSCVACDEGTFSTGGSVVCDSCPTGTFQDEIGQKSCKPCPTGRFERNTGSSVCSFCAPGSFMASTGALICDFCEPGTFTNQTGASRCDECVAGQFQDDVNQTVCKACELGKATNVGRQRTCPACLPGLFAPSTGSRVCQQCQTGKSQDSVGASYCKDCVAGRFQNSVGQSLCTLCDPGKATSLTGQLQCTDCGIGRFQILQGKQQCDPCPGGFFLATEGGTQCTACETGRFGNITGATFCPFCEAGKFQAAEGKEQCTECPLARFSNGRGQSQCLGCEAGRFGEQTGATSCSPCPVGSFNGNEAKTTCEFCSPGFFSTSAQTVCTVCGSGTVTPSNGSSSCQACGDNSGPNFFRTACDCNAGFFRPDNEGSVLECRNCPFGAQCDSPGVRFSTMEAAPGWWRSSLTDTFFIRCRVRRFCVGGRGTTDPATGKYSGSRCQDNRGGPLCELCNDGFYVQAGGSCTACPESEGSWAFFVFVGFIIALLIWLQLYVILYTGEHILNRHEQRIVKNVEDNKQLSPDEADEAFRAANLDPASSLKSSSRMIPDRLGSGSDSDSDVSSGSSSYYSSDDSDYSSSDGSISAVSGRPSIVSHAKPAKSKTHESLRESIAHGDYDANLLNDHKTGGMLADIDQDDRVTKILNKEWPEPPPPDFTYRLKIFVAFVQIVSALSEGLEIQWPNTYKDFVLYFDVTNFDFMTSGLECVGTFGYYQRFILTVTVPPAFMVLLFVVYYLPEHCRNPRQTAADYKRLFRYETNYWRMFLYSLFLIYPAVSSTVLRHYVCKDIFGTQYLLADLNEECFTDTWTFYSFGSISLVVLYPIGIPLFFYMLLRINRKQLDDPKVMAQLGFLYAGYQQDVWWFEIADCAHKLFLTSVLAFFPQAAQLPIGMAAAVLYLIVILVLSPYLRREDDTLHQLAQTEIFLLIMAGNVFYHLEVPEFSARDDLVMSICLIAVTMGFLALFLGYALHYAKNWCVDCIRDIREKRAKSKVLEVDGTSDDYEAPRIHATHKHSHHSSSGDRGPIVSGPVMPEARSGASPRIELTPMGTNGPPPITGQPVAPSPLAPLPPVGVRPPAGGPGVGGRRGLAPLGPSALPPIRK